MRIPLLPIVFIFGFAAIFSSCSKDGALGCAGPPYPPSIPNVNLTAYNGSQLLTFNAQGTFTATRSTLSITGLWQTGISTDISDALGLDNIIVNKGIIGNYSLGSNVIGGYGGDNSTGSLYPENSVIFGYNTDASHTGTLSITAYDSVHHTIAGTFSFAATGYFVDQCGNKQNGTVSITSGTFTSVPTN